ncbi:hypothetical protein ES703_65919 [subsurface metagenome]
MVGGLVLYHRIGGDVAGYIAEGVDDGVFADDSSRVGDAVTAYLGSIAQNCPQLFKAGVNYLIVQLDPDRLARGDLEVGEDDPGAGMGMVA